MVSKNGSARRRDDTDTGDGSGAAGPTALGIEPLSSDVHCDTDRYGVDMTGTGPPLVVPEALLRVDPAVEGRWYTVPVETATVDGTVPSSPLPFLASRMNEGGTLRRPVMPP